MSAGTSFAPTACGATFTNRVRPAVAGWMPLVDYGDGTPKPRKGWREGVGVHDLNVPISGEIIAYPIAAGHVVVDLDRRGGRDGLAALKKIWPAAHVTFVTTTKSGGLHLWHRLPEGVTFKNAIGIFSGVDLKVVGGFVRDVPSPGYSIARDLPVAEMPAGLVETFLKAGAAARTEAVTNRAGVGPDEFDARPPWTPSPDVEAELMEIAPLLGLEAHDGYSFMLAALKKDEAALKAAGVDAFALACRMARTAPGFETMGDADHRDQWDKATWQHASVRALFARAKRPDGDRSRSKCLQAQCPQRRRPIWTNCWPSPVTSQWRPFGGRRARPSLRRFRPST